MNQRIQQYKNSHQQYGQYGPPQAMPDLRNRLTHLREQREQEALEGILPAEDSYIHNLPKHPRHAGYGAERNTVPSNRPIGKIEWDEGKTINIRVEILENGERQYKMDKEDVFKVNIGQSRSPGRPTTIIRNENEAGTKPRGRGGYRGAPRSRGYFRGRGRGGYRGGRRPKTGKDGEKNDTADGASSTTSDVTENDVEGTTKGNEGGEVEEHEYEANAAGADEEENGNVGNESTSCPIVPRRAFQQQNVNDGDVQQLCAALETKATTIEKVETSEKAIEEEHA